MIVFKTIQKLNILTAITAVLISAVIYLYTILYIITAINEVH